MAIVQAVVKALDIILSRDLRGHLIRIFTDSKDCVNLIADIIGRYDYDKTCNYLMSYMSPMLDKLIELTDVLADRDCTLEVRWAKRRSTPPAKQADDLSRIAWKDPYLPGVGFVRSRTIRDLNEQVVGAVRGFMRRQWITWLRVALAEESHGARKTALSATLEMILHKDHRRLYPGA